MMSGRAGEMDDDESSRMRLTTHEVASQSRSPEPTLRTLQLELEGRLEEGTDGVALVVRFTGHPALATRTLLDDDDRLRFVLEHLSDMFFAVVAELEHSAEGELVGHDRTPTDSPVEDDSPEPRKMVCDQDLR